MLWTHLPNRDDIFAVFDEIRSRELDGTISGKQVMKLLRGGELLVGIRSPPANLTLTCNLGDNRF